MSVNPINFLGKNGSSLTLPYPEGFNEPVKLEELIHSFPEIVHSFEALDYLFNYPEIIIEASRVIKLSLFSPPELLIKLLTNHKFCQAKGSIILEPFVVNKGEVCSLSSNNKAFSLETFNDPLKLTSSLLDLTLSLLK